MAKERQTHQDYYTYCSGRNTSSYFFEQFRKAGGSSLSLLAAGTLPHQHRGIGQCSQTQQLPMKSGITMAGSGVALQHSKLPTIGHQHFLTPAANSLTPQPQLAHQQDIENNLPQARFPFLLYDMLQSAESRGFAGIVSWIPPTRQGEATSIFRVHDISRFEELVLPLYFNTCKYKSFQRNLNMHKYQRILNHKQATYTHSFFIRDHRELCECIKRPSSRKKLGQWDISASSSSSIIPLSNEDVFLEATRGAERPSPSLDLLEFATSGKNSEALAPYRGPGLDLLDASDTTFPHTQQQQQQRQHSIAYATRGFQQSQVQTTKLDVDSLPSVPSLGYCLPTAGETIVYCPSPRTTKKSFSTSSWMGNHEKDLISFSYQVVESWSKDQPKTSSETWSGASSP